MQVHETTRDDAAAAAALAVVPHSRYVNQGGGGKPGDHLDGLDLDPYEVIP